MKKYLKTCSIFILALMLSLILTSCFKKPIEKEPDKGEVINYFPTSKMNDEKKLYVIEGFGVERLGRHKFITSSAFQGLMNRNEVSYYVNFEIIKENTSSSQFWLDKLVEQYDLTTESISYEQMISTYLEVFGNDAGYILYDDQVDDSIGLNQTRSLTAAVNMASIRGWLPIVKDLEDEAIALGLTKKLDVSDKDEKWVFENYKDEFNNGILIQQRPFETASLPMVPLRDYAVANKFFTFFESGISATDIRFRTNVHEWAKPNMPILGWGPGDEAGHIGFASQFGQFPIPSDFSMNLSVFNADIFSAESLKQKNEFVPITPEPGKHYVAIGRSDGDNISVWANEFPLSSTDFKGASQGQFPMGWSIQPSLIDIAPGMLNILYQSASANDYFIAPVSGHGYIYPSTYPSECRADWFTTMNSYLERADLSVVEILDIGQGDILSKEIINLYAESNTLVGGINLNGHRYAGGRGAVVWSSNGKPFVSPRESLWTESKELVAARINSYTKDYTKIEGYTFINLHPWSHTYQDVEWVINNLDENVVVVSPEQFLDLISKNVEHVDKTTLEPSGNPVIVPTDPYYNKFLLDVEDWTGNVNFSNGMLKITGSGSKTYTLPNLDDPFIEFVYQAVGGNSKMKVTLTIDDVEKTIVDGLRVLSNEGLNTFQIPLNAYYSQAEYAGKKATLKVMLEDSNSQILIDNVITNTKEVFDPTSANDKLNDDFSTGLEDWYLTSFEKGAAIRHDNGMMMIDGSDGWTGLFNAHVNNSALKYFTLPNTDKISFSFRVRSSDTGTDIKAYLIIDGEVVELTDGYQYISKFETVDILKVLQGFGGKNAILVFEQKDSNKNNGIGEVCYIQKLAIGEYFIDPAHNRFDVDLEDWEVIDGDISIVPGFVKFLDTTKMEKSYHFTTLTGNYEYLLKLLFNDSSALQYRVVLKIDETVIMETAWEAIKQENIISLKDYASEVEGQEVWIIIETRTAGTALLDEFIVDKEWMIDPYNNQFEQSMEDWVLLKASGWENNKAYRDPNWPRLQFTYALNGSVTIGKTYQLLSIRNQMLQISMEGLGASAGMLQMTLTLNEDEYIIYDEQISGGVNLIEIYLDKVSSLTDVSYEDQVVTIKMTVTQIQDGAGDCFMWSFITKEYQNITFDPYHNTFTYNMEDWSVTQTSGWDNNGAVKDVNWPRLQITYALNGSVSLSKTYQLLDMKNQLIQFNLEGSGALAGLVQLSMTLGDNTYVLYDEQIASGLNTIELKLDKLTTLNDVLYENQVVVLTLTVTQMDEGAGDCFLSEFITEEYKDFDPYHNDFQTDMEDWVLLKVSGWENNKANRDPNWPRLQFTYALNGSVTIGKTYQLLPMRSQMLQISMEGLNDLAGMLLMTLTLDETEYVIYDEKIASGINLIEIALDQVSSLLGVSYEGQVVTIKMTVSQIEDGAGDCYMWSFITKEYINTTVDPYNNTFKYNMEDWNVTQTTGWDNNGAVKDSNWDRLIITYALDGSVILEKTYTLPNSLQLAINIDLEGVGENAGMVKYIVVIGDVEYTIYDAQIQAGRNLITIDLASVLDEVSFEGQVVTVKMMVSQIENGAGDCYMWGFVTKTY